MSTRASATAARFAKHQLYAGIVDVPEYGVGAKRGDVEPLISEELFYRAQAILWGRVPNTPPRKRAHPDVKIEKMPRPWLNGITRSVASRTRDQNQT